jgi:hypothetical protein
VDAFTQPKVSKVDILWIIDDSNSMSPKQDRVKANFVSFMKFLSDQQIDYHLGVITTDTFDPARGGKLVVKAANQTKPWIDLQSVPDGGAPAAFVTNASVGTGGIGDEKGLLAGMLALTAPLNSQAPAGANCKGSECFLRPDAQLYTIVVSDEEDSSCQPIRSGGVASGEGCDDDQASLSGFGSIQYWSRFLAGFCDADTAANCAAPVPDCSQVANLDKPCCQALARCHDSIVDKAQWCEVRQTATAPHYSVSGSFQGCVSRNASGKPDFTAFYASRYAAVAAATGGIATSICDQDYTPALEKLGLQASGLRSEFPLSRAPIEATIAVRVQGAAVAGGPGTWQHVPCENGKPANFIRFAKAALPPPNAKVEASYDVNVRGLTCH